ncbi:MAG: TRAM domain-containing protein, partial [Anaerolineaceae bacterium]|nr:TRAM domain-containing protein [Anaerolineaceae bacterium]
MSTIEIVTIEKNVYGGEGLAHLSDGRAVFIPYVLPGEVVRIELVEDKTRFARAVPVEIITASKERIKPRCKHFESCGGCHYQHMDYDHQLATKLSVLQDQLTRIGKINAPPLKGIIPSQKQWHYRNHVQFHPTTSGALGFINSRGDQALMIEECHLPEETLNEIWPQINIETDSGIKRISLRQDSFNEVMLLLEGDQPDVPEFELDLPVSASYLDPEGYATLLAGEDALIYEIKGHHLHVSPESFFQVNIDVAEKMVDHFLELLPQDDKKINILELYCGVGLFSIFLVEKAAQLTAIESSRSSCYDFAINLDAFDNISLYEAPVEDTLPIITEKPDLVLLDPPRSGLNIDARLAITKLAPPEMIYI